MGETSRITRSEKIFILENVINLQFDNFRIGDQRVDGLLHWRIE
jgi:hypothetical protein